MKPTPERAEEGDTVDIFRPEQFVRQVADDSLPAAEVLKDQKQESKAEDPAPLFVP